MRRFCALISLVAVTSCGTLSQHNATNDAARPSFSSVERVGDPPLTATGRAASSAAPPATPWVPEVTLAVYAPCVVPGGRQTEIVTTAPGLQVSLSPRYSDYRSGYGGADYGETIPESGVFSRTFTVSTDAPVGSVIVWVGAARGTREVAKAAATFAVAARC